MNGDKEDANMREFPIFSSQRSTYNSLNHSAKSVTKLQKEVKGTLKSNNNLRGDAGRKIAFFAKISTFEILLLKSLLIIQLSFPQRS